MRQIQKLWYRCAVIAAGLAAVAWLLPQTLYRECVHAVIPEEQKEAAGDGLQEEEAERLFKMESSDYKIVLWFDK